MTQERPTAYLAPALSKGFKIIEEVAGAPGELGITDLARRLGLPKSTVHGLTGALVELGALVQEPRHKRFRLGPLLVRLGREAARELSLEALAQPYLEELSQRLEETVFLGTCDWRNITITAHAESPRELKISAPPGARLPLLAAATAKAFLSLLPDQEVQALLARQILPAFTPRSLTDPGEFLREVQRVRERGYATDYEEYLRGVNAVSVPLVGPRRNTPAAIWVVGFSQSFTPQRMEQAATVTLETCRSIQGLLHAGR